MSATSDILYQAFLSFSRWRFRGLVDTTSYPRIEIHGRPATMAEMMSPAALVRSYPRGSMSFWRVVARTEGLPPPPADLVEAVEARLHAEAVP